MSFWWLFLLVPGLLIEAYWAVELRAWKGTLELERRHLDDAQRQCYACVTKASVMSFSERSAGSFCSHHRAHWALINDLEHQVLDDHEVEGGRWPKSDYG